MKFDDKQRQTFVKSLVSIGTYSLTTIPFGFFMGSKDISVWLYIGITFMGIGLLALGIYFSKEEKKDTQDDKIINAEIKKGVFHIDNATINKNKQEA